MGSKINDADLRSNARPKINVIVIVIVMNVWAGKAAKGYG